MRKSWIAGAVVACVAFAGLLYASPYITLHSMGKAVDRKDADAVSEHVDFPALRENLKGQMLIKMQAELASPEMKENPFAGLGQMLAAGLINQLADTWVTPAGVMAMLASGKPKKPETDAEQPQQARRDFVVDYQGWSRVFVHKRDETDGFYFKRHGLMNWKLVAVKME